MRACVIAAGDRTRVSLFHVHIWEKPDTEYVAVMAVPAGDMVGPEAIKVVCDQLQVPVPPPSDGATILTGPEVGRFKGAVTKAVKSAWMRL